MTQNTPNQDYESAKEMLELSMTQNVSDHDYEPAKEMSELFVLAGHSSKEAAHESEELQRTLQVADILFAAQSHSDAFDLYEMTSSSLIQCGEFDDMSLFRATLGGARSSLLPSQHKRAEGLLRLVLEEYQKLEGKHRQKIPILQAFLFDLGNDEESVDEDRGVHEFDSNIPYKLQVIASMERSFGRNCIEEMHHIRSLRIFLTEHSDEIRVLLWECSSIINSHAASIDAFKGLVPEDKLEAEEFLTTLLFCLFVQAWTGNARVRPAALASALKFITENISEVEALSTAANITAKRTVRLVLKEASGSMGAYFSHHGLGHVLSRGAEASSQSKRLKCAFADRLVGRLIESPRSRRGMRSPNAQKLLRLFVRNFIKNEFDFEGGTANLLPYPADVQQFELLQASLSRMLPSLPTSPTASLFGSIRMIRLKKGPASLFSDSTAVSKVSDLTKCLDDRSVWGFTRVTGMPFSDLESLPTIPDQIDIEEEQRMNIGRARSPSMDATYSC